MPAFLLAVIYLSFIGLGLPDSLLGAAWPSMQPVLGVPVSCAGVLSMIISCSTVCSSLLADRLLRRAGTGLVSGCSIMLVSAAMFGFSAAGDFGVLCLCAIPYGLGAGAVDAALNHYAAVHYPARHLIWLHCFWGIGCAAGPYIIRGCMQAGAGWQGGFRTAALIQAGLSAILFLVLPFWVKTPAGKSAQPGTSLRDVLHSGGMLRSLPAFFCCCALENTAGLWASSYLVQVRGTDTGSAAGYAALFYLGIMAGRLACGFLAGKCTTARMTATGGFTVLAGILLLALSENPLWALCGLLITGLGCAPVYPSLLADTPERFGAAAAQRLIGMQVASAYLGTTLMPPLFGLLAGRAGMQIFPMFLLLMLSLLALWK